jgi:methyl coenzyme M reductase subunit D
VPFSPRPTEYQDPWFEDREEYDQSVEDEITGLATTVAGKANTSDLANYSPATHQHPGAGANSIVLGSSAISSGGSSIAIGAFSLSSATSSIAIGFTSEATAYSSISIGNGRIASGGGAVGIGGNARGDFSVAIGESSDTGPAATQGVVVGNSAFVDAVAGTALGHQSSVPSTSPRSVAIGKSAQIPASTPDRGVIRVNDLEVKRSSGTGATTLRLASPDGTIGIVSVTDTDGLQVNGVTPSPATHQHPGAGANSVAIGTGATASASATTAIGPYSEATGAGATAIGNSKTAYGARAMSIGGFADAPDSVAIGDSADIAVAATEAISIGSGSYVDGVSGIAIGGQATVPSTSPRSISIGQGAFIPASTPDRGIIRVNDLEVKRSNGTGATTLRLASPDGTIGIVSVTDTDGLQVNGVTPSPATHNHPGTGTRSVVLGANAGGTGNDIVAVGETATTTGHQGTAVGRFSSAGALGTAIGNGAASSGSSSAAIGAGSVASASMAYAMGFGAEASGVNSVAIGAQSWNPAADSVAIGYNAAVPATSPRSVALGALAGVPASTPDRGIIQVNDFEVKRSNGTGATTLRLASPDGTIGIVSVTDTDGLQVNGVAPQPGIHQHPGAGTNSVAIGPSATAAGVAGVAVGGFAIASGSASVALGIAAEASGLNAISIGNGLVASGAGATGIGGSARGAYSVAIGGFSSTAALADDAIAIGDSAGGDGVQSIAIGANAIVPATSPRSVAIGNFSQIPASTPDRGIIRVNDLEVKRSNGTGATTLRLASPDGTIGAVAVTDTDGLTVNGAAVGGGGTPTATQDAAVLPIQYSDNWTISASELGRGYLAQADTLAVTDTSIMIVDFFVPYTITIDSLNISVGTLEVGGLVRIGLWQMSDDGNTHTTLVDAGTVDTDTTGGKIALITPIVLNRGWYQNGVIRSIGNTLIRIRSFSPAVKSYGGFNGGGGTYNISASGGYRTLPHAGGAAVPFDASYGAGNKSILALAAPAVYMRVQR